MPGSMNTDIPVHMPRMLFRVLPRNEYRCSSGLTNVRPLSVDSAYARYIGSFRFGSGGSCELQFWADRFGDASLRGAFPPAVANGLLLI